MWNYLLANGFPSTDKKNKFYPVVVFKILYMHYSVHIFQFFYNYKMKFYNSITIKLFKFIIYFTQYI